jgi:uncharacterized protein (DUF1800 family)
VDLFDFAYLSKQWQTNGLFEPSADISPQPGDGVVDFTDHLFLADNWLLQENRVELLYDDFESGFGNYTDGGSDCSLYTGGIYAHQGSNAVSICDNSGSASSFWLVQEIDVDTPGYTWISIEFWYRTEGMENAEDFKLQYFNGTSWETVRTWRRRNKEKENSNSSDATKDKKRKWIDFQNGRFYFESVIISESNYVFPTNMNIRFQCDARSDDDNVYIDEIRITAAGGVGLALSNPDESSFEKSSTPARWIIETIGSDNSSVSVNFSVSGIEGNLFGAASPGDYELRDAKGNIVTSPVTISVPDYFEIFLYPVDDGIAEPRENAMLSIEPGNYAVTSNHLSVNIYDATDDPANNNLLVAMLLPENNARTTASGVATIVINGNQTQALVSSSFNGLTSIQTATHLHYANPQDPQNGVGTAIFSLPSGQFSKVIWDITATGGYTITEIIDALYQQNGLNIYQNVHTQSYPVGEIRGPFIKQDGSPEFFPPDPPAAHEVLTGVALLRDVVRFLMQATFGPKQTEIDSLYDSIVNAHSGNRIAGYEAWIDNQFGLDQTSLETLLYYIDENEFAKEGLTRDGGVYFSNVYGTPAWVHWDLALHAHDQLRQRMAFALSEIVVISKFANDVIAYVHYAPEKYWDMLADHADGNYFDVLYDVSKSPLMGSYLSHLANRKAVIDPQTGQTIVSPDENYVRELLQLFSIGLLELHPDGTLRLNSSGLVMETYDNEDIIELARVFTGWGLSKQTNGDENNYFFLISPGPILNNERWVHPMKNFAQYHDTEAKTFLSRTIPSGLDGEQDLHAALDIIFNHSNVGPFISRRLIQRFVTSSPSKDYIYRVAQVFDNDGAGKRGNLKAVIKAILLDYEARSLAFVDDPNNNSFGKVKEPIIAFIQFCRAFNMIPDPNSTDFIADLVAVGYPAGQADNFPPNWAVIGSQSQSSSFGFGFGFDQKFMSASSAFNYYLPDYSPGKDISAAGLFSPELQIADEYTLAIRHREMWEKLYYTTRDWPIDLTQFQQIYDTAKAAGATDLEAAEVLVDHLDLLLTAGILKIDYANAPVPNPRSIIIDTVAAQSDTLQTGKALTAPYLIVTSPAFNVQR